MVRPRLGLLGFGAGTGSPEEGREVESRIPSSSDTHSAANVAASPLQTTGTGVALITQEASTRRRCLLVIAGFRLVGGSRLGLLLLLLRRWPGAASPASPRPPARRRLALFADGGRASAAAVSNGSAPLGTPLGAVPRRRRRRGGWWRPRLRHPALPPRRRRVRDADLPQPQPGSLPQLDVPGEHGDEVPGPREHVPEVRLEVSARSSSVSLRGVRPEASVDGLLARGGPVGPWFGSLRAPSATGRSATRGCLVPLDLLLPPPDDCLGVPEAARQRRRRPRGLASGAPRRNAVGPPRGLQAQVYPACCRPRMISCSPLSALKPVTRRRRNDRHPPRTPPRFVDDAHACAANLAEEPAHRHAVFSGAHAELADVTQRLSPLARGSAAAEGSNFRRGTTEKVKPSPPGSAYLTCSSPLPRPGPATRTGRRTAP